LPNGGSKASIEQAVHRGAMRAGNLSTSADEHLRKFIRYGIMGHQVGDDVNARHYMTASIAERFAMVAAVEYELPPM
jgi:hypothetical protein